MTEGLLHDHPPGLRQPGRGQSPDHRSEQERRNLQVEDRAGGLTAAEGCRDRTRHALIGGGVGEVAAHVGQACGEAVEHVRVQRLTGAFDARARVLAQMLERPIVARDAHDRTLQQPAPLQSVERAKRHHLGQIAGDAEHDQHVSGGGTLRVRHVP